MNVPHHSQASRRTRRPGWLSLLVRCAVGVLILAPAVRGAEPARKMRLHWEANLLTVTHPELPERWLEINYLEAFCRGGSTDRDWGETVIPHRTERLEEAGDGSRVVLRSVLEDGVVVDHVLTAGEGEVDFRLTVTHREGKASEVQWAQPCIRVHRFTGTEPRPNTEAYLPRCFLYLDGRLTRLPTEPWATEARYVPGQVWCPAHVDRNDVNPRPLNPRVPSNGLIGCFSEDERWIFATAWEPYQELFQGVICCLHSDFRIGGLRAGERKTVRGKIYILPAGPEELERRYRRDFPEHVSDPPGTDGKPGTDR